MFPGFPLTGSLWGRWLGHLKNFSPATHSSSAKAGLVSCSIPLKLKKKVGFSSPYSAWLPTQDKAVVVSPTCLLVHLSGCACAHCWQRQSTPSQSPVFKIWLQVNVLATAIFEPDIGSDFQLILKMAAGKSLGSDCLKVFRRS